MKIISLYFLFFSILISSSECRRHLDNVHRVTFNMVNFGASGDGNTDDTQAFKKTWEAACTSTSASPTMHVPYGYTFLLQPVTFKGPCNSKIVNVKIDGTLISPSNPSKWKCNGGKCKQWITFHEIDGLKISGSGSIDGQGSKWWDCKMKNHGNKKVCKRSPTSFVLSHCNNVHLRDLSFINSPQMHIALERSTYVYASKITVTAPSDSPNTDGIHIQNSQNIFISDSHIGTGDDCISIGDGSKYLNISTITCGPGHGISIGSLGSKGRYETVEHVYVNDVTFNGTSNGVRIKTWQGGRGFARHIKFENIHSFDSENPIIIDQFYCDHQLCKNQNSAVQVSDITYSHVHGTYKKDMAVKFACSDSVPCKNIYMNDINLRSTQDTSDTTSICRNVERGRGDGNIFPRIPCLN